MISLVIGNIIKPQYITKVEDNLILLEVLAGLFDFSYTSVDKWIFADGTESTEERPTRTLTEDQTVKLYVTDYNGLLVLNATNNNYVGNISSISKLTHGANLRGADAHGDISALSKLTYLAQFDTTEVSGDIKALSNLTYSADFRGVNVFGDISALKNLTGSADFWNTKVSGDIISLKNLTGSLDLSYTDTYGDISVLTKLLYVNLRGTQVSGILSPPNGAYGVYLNSTSMTSSDTLQTLRNMNTNFTSSNITRYVQLVDNIDQTSDEVIELVNNLTIKKCTILFT